MAKSVTIRRSDVVRLIGEAAEKFTNGDKTEAVYLAVRRLLAAEERKGSLFGAHPGSVRVKPGVDLTAPDIGKLPDAEKGHKARR